MKQCPGLSNPQAVLKRIITLNKTKDTYCNKNSVIGKKSKNASIVKGDPKVYM